MTNKIIDVIKHYGNIVLHEYVIPSAIIGGVIGGIAGVAGLVIDLATIGENRSFNADVLNHLQGDVAQSLELSLEDIQTGNTRALELRLYQMENESYLLRPQLEPLSDAYESGASNYEAPIRESLANVQNTELKDPGFHLGVTMRAGLGAFVLSFICSGAALIKVPRENFRNGRREGESYQ